jgi:hypothetical protein
VAGNLPTGPSPRRSWKGYVQLSTEVNLQISRLLYNLHPRSIYIFPKLSLYPLCIFSLDLVVSDIINHLLPTHPETPLCGVEVKNEGEQQDQVPVCHVCGYRVVVGLVEQVCVSQMRVFSCPTGSIRTPRGGGEEKVQLTVTLVSRNGGPVNRKSDKDSLKGTQEGVDDKAEH